jgi:hypothetical protein
MSSAISSTAGVQPVSTNSLSEPVRAAIGKIYSLLLFLFVVVALLLILVSLVLAPGNSREIVRGFGLGLLPAGIVALMVSKFAESLTENLIRNSIENTIREGLDKDVALIDRTVGDGLERIDTSVQEGTERIRADMQRLSPLVASASKLGLENVHLTRTDALAAFAWFLDAEAARAERQDGGRVWIVSSSIKGFIEAAVDNYDGRRMMERLASNGCQIRIMMTDPEVADFRAEQEGREKGEIPKEIEMNLAYLKRIGVKRESIRFYRGTPTVFAIATQDRMLLNPYPYQSEAFRCFSIVVHKTLNQHADIYHQYLRFHFEEPWTHATEVPPDRWNRLR